MHDDINKTVYGSSLYRYTLNGYQYNTRVTIKIVEHDNID